jgi:hypothetical protein
MIVSSENIRSWWPWLVPVFVVSADVIDDIAERTERVWKGCAFS